MVGIVTAAATQAVDWAQKKYHVDISVYGLTINDIVSYALDAIGAAALYVAAHSRATSPHAPVTMTKAQAVAINNPQP